MRMQVEIRVVCDTSEESQLLRNWFSGGHAPSDWQHVADDGLDSIYSVDRPAIINQQDNLEGL